MTLNPAEFTAVWDAASTEPDGILIPFIGPAEARRYNLRLHSFRARFWRRLLKASDPRQPPPPLPWEGLTTRQDGATIWVGRLTPAMLGVLEK